MRCLHIIILSLFVIFGCNNTHDTNSDTVENSRFESKYDAKKISKYILSKTVSITMQDKQKQPVSYGSGVILEKGLILTNRHVIENATYGFIELNKNKHKIDGYVAIDKTNDLVILKIPSLVEEGIIRFRGQLATGEKVYVAGNPQGLSETVTNGIVSNPNRKFEEKELIQISAPISPGSSGGPVVNDVGELIGVAVGGLTEGQNLNFAVPIKHIEKLMQKIDKIHSLDIKTTKKKLDEIINTNPNDWVVIRRLKFYTKEVYNKDYHNTLEEFSILNKTEWPISSILILFIAYDKTGIPVDYKTYRLFTNQQILPGLARTVDVNAIFGIGIKKPERGKIESRVLDYILHYE